MALGYFFSFLAGALVVGVFLFLAILVWGLLGRCR